ncbi:hypothetical protein EVAR_35584_1 [Eumeta japonica]|uniref:Uncharacterized protein n=1 Tax=Eumeta variegata TaxID=151549 RepID=A0A4C1XPR6_EUMVA|nr:hypothetical protein EVAR_35584_1 [Eumeta japonica]
MARQAVGHGPHHALAQRGNLKTQTPLSEIKGSLHSGCSGFIRTKDSCLGFHKNQGQLPRVSEEPRTAASGFIRTKDSCLGFHKN